MAAYVERVMNGGSASDPWHSFSSLAHAQLPPAGASAMTD